MVQFEKVMEHLEGGISLEEVDHCGECLEILKLNPTSFTVMQCDWPPPAPAAMMDCISLNHKPG